VRPLALLLGLLGWPWSIDTWTIILMVSQVMVSISFLWCIIKVVKKINQDIEKEEATERQKSDGK
jgi:hypothetical protein